jgi:beta-galactosidase
MIPKGHEVAWDQFILNKGITVAPKLASKVAVLNIKNAKNKIQVSNNSTFLKINSTSGEIISWAFKGKEITNHPIKPNFWRPPIDNDLGNGMDKWAKNWQDASYNYIAKLIKKPIRNNKKVSYAVSYHLPKDEATIIVYFTIHNSGALTVDYSFKANQKELPNIPRLGMFLTLNNDFSNISWYGKGPEESYWDRKTGQKTGIYSGKIEEQFHAYPRPQETGNKTDVRWMQIASKDINLKATSQHLFNASVWPFDMKEVDFNSNDAGKSASGLIPVTKKHGADIKIGSTVQWNIDYKQMGVGGDTSWGRFVHKEYTIKANKTYEYSFTIVPTKSD